MALHLTDHRRGFGAGWTDITSFDDAEDNTGIGLAALKLAPGERLDTVAECETAWLLMAGSVEVTLGNDTRQMDRGSLFDEGPSCVHASARERIAFHALSDVEFTVYRSANGKSFRAAIYGPGDVADEARGKGQVGGACHRLVRTIFDGTTSDANCELVLGEVITLPGRWSSYPPHHHSQPEIYHYRFTHPQGYGHAELGERVYKVRQFDTVKIFDGNDHAQCAAPGYGMYYAWVIRHLPDNPYTVPEFTAEHRWVMAPDAAIWRPRGGADYD